MIRTISFKRDTESEYVDKYNQKLEWINGLRKINIFVGENNAGKSRMMRKIFSSEAVDFYDENFASQDQKNQSNEYKRNLKNRMRSISTRFDANFNKIVSDLENYSELELFDKGYDVFRNIELFVKDKIESHEYNSIQSSMTNYIETFHKRDGSGANYKLNHTNSLYIPILRGIENFEKYYGGLDGMENIKMTISENSSLNRYVNQSKNIYKNKICKIYKLKEERVFTAEELYDEITDKLLGSEKERLFIREFQKFISDTFYNGVNFSIIPYKKGNYLNIKISDTEDRALHNMGEGIKQVIILLYKMFEKKDDEMIFFIEEPEINLHPGFQRKIIEVFQNGIFSKHQIFLTTHSNHILDVSTESDDIAIFKTKNIENKNKKFMVEKVNSRDISILEELGVNNSSVFLSNCSIWVEGISDRLYLKRYLEMYFRKHNINKYKEDINYSFVEYSGSNITHWSFLNNDDNNTINAQYLNNHIFLVCDNDNTDEGSKKWQRKQTLKTILGDNFFELKSREIENVISKKVLEEMLKKDNGQQILQFKKPRQKEFDETLYAIPSVKLHKFIDETYQLSKSYTDSKGYFKDKVSFAKKIVNEINDYDDLSSQAKELIEKIYTFIVENN